MKILVASCDKNEDLFEPIRRLSVVESVLRSIRRLRGIFSGVDFEKGPGAGNRQYGRSVFGRISAGEFPDRQGHRAGTVVPQGRRAQLPAGGCEIRFFQYGLAQSFRRQRRRFDQEYSRVRLAVRRRSEGGVPAQRHGALYALLRCAGRRCRDQSEDETGVRIRRSVYAFPLRYLRLLRLRRRFFLGRCRPAQNFGYDSLPGEVLSGFQRSADGPAESLRYKGVYRFDGPALFRRRRDLPPRADACRNDCRNDPRRSGDRREKNLLSDLCGRGEDVCAERTCRSFSSDSFGIAGAGSGTCLPRADYGACENDFGMDTNGDTAAEKPQEEIKQNPGDQSVGEKGRNRLNMSKFRYIIGIAATLLLIFLLGYVRYCWGLL